MRRLSRSLVLGLVVVVGVAVAWRPSQGDLATSSERSPGDPAETATENADLEDYSTAYGVSPVQALLEWEATDLAGELQVALIDTEADVFGGLWIEHQPFVIVVGVLPGGEKAVQEHIERLGLATVTRLKETEFTLAQLRSDQAALDAVAPFGVDFASGIDQSMGRVEVNGLSQFRSTFQPPPSMTNVTITLGGALGFRIPGSARPSGGSNPSKPMSRAADPRDAGLPEPRDELAATLRAREWLDGLADELNRHTQ